MTENDKTTKDGRMEAFWVYLCACIWAQMHSKKEVRNTIQSGNSEKSLNRTFHWNSKRYSIERTLHFPTPPSDGRNLSLAVIWFFLVLQDLGSKWQFRNE